VLIHGWGLHGGIWDNLLPLLTPRLRVTCVDLPGHGHSDWSGEAGLDDMVDAVYAAVPGDAVWLGWSLGGLVATRAAARLQDSVRGLVSVASNPCFLRRPDWQSAMLPELLQAFAQDLEKDYRQTLDRFLALQVRGSEAATTILRSLRAAMATRAMPHPDGLRAGLDILAGSDLRQALGSVVCPVLLLAGERDTLVPLAALQAARELFPAARLEVFPGAGHAPFISDPARFAQCVTDFIYNDR